MHNESGVQDQCNVWGLSDALRHDSGGIDFGRGKSSDESAERQAQEDSHH